MSSIPLPALSIKQPESPLSNLSDLLHAKAQQQGLQTGQLQQQALQQEIAQRDQQAKDLQATTAAARNWDGKDYDALSKSILKNGGSANAAMSIQQHGLTIKKTVSDIAATDATTGSKNLETFIGKHKAIGDALEGIEKVPDDQLHQAAAAKINELAQGGILDQATGQQLLQGVQSIQDPKALRDQIDIFAKSSMGAKAAAEQEKSTAETRQKNAQAALEEMQAKYGTPGTMEAKYLAIQQKQNQKQPLTPEEASFSKAYEKNKTLVPQYNFTLQNQGTTGAVADVAKRFGMTPVAFDQAAEKFWTSGQLPPAGRGGPALAMNKALMNRAGELHPEGGSLAANSAEFKANSASLKDLQTKFDSVDAFENTAIRNIDRVIQTGKDIPDLGARFANVPIRMLNEKLLGTPAMAKFRADLLTAQNESAKVLNSANANGVLSDSARGEVHEMVNGNMTYPAMVAAFNELKNDMGNRHQSYAEQIKTIQGRLGGKATPSPTGEQKDKTSHPFFSQFGGTVR